MRGLPSILSLFHKEFNKFNDTRARKLVSIYHIIYMYLCTTSNLLGQTEFWSQILAQRFKYCGILSPNLLNLNSIMKQMYCKMKFKNKPPQDCAMFFCIESTQRKTTENEHCVVILTLNNSYSLTLNGDQMKLRILLHFIRICAVCQDEIDQQRKKYILVRSFNL